MLTLLLACHVAFAILASARYVEIVTQDRIGAPIRRYAGRYYLTSCIRCLSVWAGALATLAFFIWPWLNWPFALSWLVLTRKPTTILRGVVMPRTAEQVMRESIYNILAENAHLIAQVEAARTTIAELEAQVTSLGGTPVTTRSTVTAEVNGRPTPA